MKTYEQDSRILSLINDRVVMGLTLENEIIAMIHVQETRGPKVRLAADPVKATTPEAAMEYYADVEEILDSLNTAENIVNHLRHFPQYGDPQSAAFYNGRFSMFCPWGF